LDIFGFRIDLISPDGDFLLAQIDARVAPTSKHADVGPFDLAGMAGQLVLPS
jgi:hypothetical protein